MPECRVVPCYKKFLNELTDIVSTGHFNLNSPPPIETFDFGVGGGNGAASTASSTGATNATSPPPATSPQPRYHNVATETSPQPPNSTAQHHYQHHQQQNRSTPLHTQFRFSDSRKESSANLNPSKVLRRQVVSAVCVCVCAPQTENLFESDQLLF